MYQPTKEFEPEKLGRKSYCKPCDDHFYNERDRNSIKLFKKCVFCRKEEKVVKR